MEAEDRPRRRRESAAPTDPRLAIRERLTGAAILVLVVVLVVPSLLTGRRPAAPDRDPSGPTKTYEIELADSREPASEDLRRPLPEPAPVVPPKPRTLPPPPQAASPQAAPASGVRTPPTGLPPVTTATQVPQRTSTAPVSPPSAPVAATPPVQQPSAAPAATAPVAWAVQLGAFAGRDTASKLVAELRARGYAAFMLELRRDGKVLYRVRVGPEPERARAVAIAERLNREGYKASVAAHP